MQAKAYGVDINAEINKLPYPREVQDALFDAFYQPKASDLKSSLDAIDVPKTVKAALWDLRSKIENSQPYDISSISASSRGGAAPGQENVPDHAALATSPPPTFTQAPPEKFKIDISGKELPPVPLKKSIQTQDYETTNKAPTAPAAISSIPFDELDAAQIKTQAEQGKPAFTPAIAPTGATIGPAPEPGFLEHLKGIVVGTPGHPTAIGEALGYKMRGQYDPENTSPSFLNLTGLGPENPKTAKEAIARGVGEFATGMMSPDNLLLMLGTEGIGTLTKAFSAIKSTPLVEKAAVSASKYIPRAISGIFTADLLQGLVDQYPEVKSAVESGNPVEIAKAATQATLTAGMLYLTGKHALGEEAVKTQQAPSAPELKTGLKRGPLSFESTPPPPSKGTVKPNKAKPKPGPAPVQTESTTVEAEQAAKPAASIAPAEAVPAEAGASEPAAAEPAVAEQPTPSTPGVKTGVKGKGKGKGKGVTQAAETESAIKDQPIQPTEQQRLTATATTPPWQPETAGKPAELPPVKDQKVEEIQPASASKEEYTTQKEGEINPGQTPEGTAQSTEPVTPLTKKKKTLSKEDKELKNSVQKEIFESLGSETTKTQTLESLQEVFDKVKNTKFEEPYTKLYDKINKSLSKTAPPPKKLVYDLSSILIDIDKSGVMDKPAAITPTAPPPSVKQEILEPSVKHEDIGESGSKWVKTQDQKGSNPGGVYKDSQGTEYYVKFPQKNQKQVYHEKISDDIYRTLGIPVKDSKIIQLEGKTGIASPYFKSAGPIDKKGASSFKSNPDLRKGFLADAYLGNWDVFGLNDDNIIRRVNDDGSESFVRVDNGGTLFSRAQGDEKPFSKDSVPEIESLQKHQWGTVYLSKSEQTEQATKIATKLKDQVIENIVNNSGIPESEKSKYIETLKGRRDYLIKRYDVTADPPQAPDIKHVLGENSQVLDEHKFYSFHKAIKALQPPIDQTQTQSLNSYTLNGYKNVNKLLRTPQELKHLHEREKKEIKDKIKHISNAIKHSRLDHSVTLYRGTNLPISILNKAKKDYKFKDKGFLSTSLNPSITKSFSNSYLSKDPKVFFQLKAPAGAVARAVGEGEDEILFDKGQHWKLNKIEEHGGITFIYGEYTDE